MVKYKDIKNISEEQFFDKIVQLKGDKCNAEFFNNNALAKKIERDINFLNKIYKKAIIKNGIIIGYKNL